MKSKLNYREIESLPTSDSRTTKHIVEGVMLLIESKKKGGGKYFAGKYRVPNNKNPKYYQIGVFGKELNQFTPNKAIEKWMEIKKWAVDNNKTPKEYKLEQKKKITSTLDKPNFIKAVEKFLQIRRDKVKPTTWREYKRKLNQVVDWQNSSFYPASNY